MDPDCRCIASAKTISGNLGRGQLRLTSATTNWFNKTLRFRAPQKMGLKTMTHCNKPSVLLTDARWVARVTYKSKDGLYNINYTFSHPEELGELIEAAQERHKIIEVEILLCENGS
jgi:hypothetical protein